MNIPKSGDVEKDACGGLVIKALFKLDNFILLGSDFVFLTLCRRRRIIKESTNYLHTSNLYKIENFETSKAVIRTG